ncbi:hypothetical protein M885DRAFT_516412 [Pelagophyceae sp. CCMP2097]|nr:hypothetical protein M885DRAFT_516412 [Pelagophyceae sp. CCMP2097]|mmetsp:Transcript_26468/g.91094  ORF Transcript_26468/g.91094 Transcript_26468/m.91094 type:complete len:542 (+) Transcript_26468:35-1660(+)
MSTLCFGHRSRVSLRQLVHACAAHCLAASRRRCAALPRGLVAFVALGAVALALAALRRRVVLRPVEFRQPALPFRDEVHRHAAEEVVGKRGDGLGGRRPRVLDDGEGGAERIDAQGRVGRRASAVVKSRAGVVSAGPVRARDGDESDDDVRRRRGEEEARGLRDLGQIVGRVTPFPLGEAPALQRDAGLGGGGRAVDSVVRTSVGLERRVGERVGEEVADDVAVAVARGGNESGVGELGVDLFVAVLLVDFREPLRRVDGRAAPRRRRRLDDAPHLRQSPGRRVRDDLRNVVVDWVDAIRRVHAIAPEIVRVPELAPDEVAVLVVLALGVALRVVVVALAPGQEAPADQALADPRVFSRQPALPLVAVLAVGVVSLEWAGVGDVLAVERALRVRDTLVLARAAAAGLRVRLGLHVRLKGIRRAPGLKLRPLLRRRAVIVVVAAVHLDDGAGAARLGEALGEALRLGPRAQDRGAVVAGALRRGRGHRVLLNMGEVARVGRGGVIARALRLCRGQRARLNLGEVRQRLLREAGCGCVDVYRD